MRSVPRVAVPVEEVMLEPKVTAPVTRPDTASVPIVAVPVEAVMLEPKVMLPN